MYVSRNFYAFASNVQSRGSQDLGIFIDNILHMTAKPKSFGISAAKSTEIKENVSLILFCALKNNTLQKIRYIYIYREQNKKNQRVHHISNKRLLIFRSSFRAVMAVTCPFSTKLFLDKFSISPA